MDVDTDDTLGWNLQNNHVREEWASTVVSNYHNSLPAYDVDGDLISAPEYQMNFENAIARITFGLHRYDPPGGDKFSAEIITMAVIHQRSKRGGGEKRKLSATDPFLAKKKVKKVCLKCLSDRASPKCYLSVNLNVYLWYISCYVVQ